MNRRYLFNIVLSVAFLQVASLTKAQVVDHIGVSGENQNVVMFSHSEEGGLQGMVKGADLIVIGRIEAIEDEFVFYGYDKNLEEQYKRLEETSTFTVGIPFVDYRVTVEEVLKDDELSPLLLSSKSTSGRPETPTSVTLRKPALEPANLGLDMMLFLSLNPDGQTYGVKSFTGQLYLADSSIAYFDLNTRTVELAEFAENVPVITFSNAIKTLVESDVGL